MAKGKVIGGLSFSPEGYEKFVSLTKEKQLEKVYNSLNPKDFEQAEKLLKNVPNGNIRKGISKEATSNSAENRTGNGKNNPEKPEANKG